MTRATEDVYAAWCELVGESEPGQKVWSDLVIRWSEPHRSYHNLGHLVAVLGIVEKFSAYADDLPAVLLAAWFHDAVYDPRSESNEVDSADLAVAQLSNLDQPAARVQEVRRLILMTAAHEAGADRNSALLSEADLAVLGSPPAAYLGYVNAVRQEYAHVSDEDFRIGRSAILQGILDRDRIYLIDPIHDEIESTARLNLAAELSLYQPKTEPTDPMEEIMRNLPNLLPRNE